MNEFDLPKSFAHLIAKLYHKEHPRDTAAINRDGTLVVSTEYEYRLKEKFLEFEFGKIYVKYKLIDKKTIEIPTTCRVCKSRYMKKRYKLVYVIDEIWYGRHDVTDRYKSGGNLTETKSQFR